MASVLLELGVVDEGVNDGLDVPRAVDYPKNVQALGDRQVENQVAFESWNWPVSKAPKLHNSGRYDGPDAGVNGNALECPFEGCPELQSHLRPSFTQQVGGNGGDIPSC